MLAWRNSVSVCSQ